jgi:hypothetical protein
MAPGIAGIVTGALAAGQPLYRAAEFDADLVEAAAAIERGDFAGDQSAVIQQMIAQMQRGITSGMTAFPVREDLEAEAKILVPVETPLRNRLPRTLGEGTASDWKQITSFGTGFGTVTTASGAANAADTLEVDNANGFYPGETIEWDNTGGGGPEQHKIVSINYTTDVITVEASPGITLNAQTDADSVTKVSFFQPGGGTATQAFFKESGAPAEKTTVYADRQEAYKMLGEIGQVTVFAMAAGANFQNQLATEKRNRLYSVMLSEENALVNADDSEVHAPWGDGTSALAFKGLIPEVRDGAPGDHTQLAVGTLTLAHLDTQLTRQHYQGARGCYMLMNGQEINSLAKLAMTSTNHRVVIESQRDTEIGIRVAKYVHPISGESVQVLWCPFVPAGTIVFGADYLPDGSPAADVRVLPQVNLPSLAPNENIQGYVAQEIAPDKSSPHDLPFIVSVFEVLRVKGHTVFALSEGVDPA